MRVPYIISSLIFFIIHNTLLDSTQPNTKSLPKSTTNSNTKFENLNLDLLPDLNHVLSELDLLSYSSKFIKVGVKATRYLLMLGDSDFSMMSWDWEMSSENIQKLKDYIKILIKNVTMPERDEKRESLLQERQKLVYGRVYIENGVQSFEYFQASFGLASIPLGRLEMVIGNPEDGCTQMNVDLTGKVLINQRGNCTYLMKAQNALACNATALIIVNTVHVLESPSSGLGTDASVTPAMIDDITKQLSIISLSNTSWAKLLHSTKIATSSSSSSDSSSMTPAVYLQIVPLKCLNQPCKPALPEESELSEVFSGRIKLLNSIGENHTYEFLTSNFGGSLPSQPIIFRIPSVRDGCSALEPLQLNSTSSTISTNTASSNDDDNTSSIIAVLISRGKCQFDIKAYHVEQAGGQLAVLYDAADGPLQRVGCSYPLCTLIGIPSITIPLPAAEFILSSLLSSSSSAINHKSENENDISNWVKGELSITTSSITSSHTDWLDISHTQWALTAADKLGQIHALIEKYKNTEKKNSSHNSEIVSWLLRQADKLHNNNNNNSNNNRKNVDLKNEL